MALPEKDSLAKGVDESQIRSNRSLCDLEPTPTFEMRSGCISNAFFKEIIEGIAMNQYISCSGRCLEIASRWSLTGSRTGLGMSSIKPFLCLAVYQQFNHARMHQSPIEYQFRVFGPGRPTVVYFRQRVEASVLTFLSIGNNRMRLPTLPCVQCIPIFCAAEIFLLRLKSDLFPPSGRNTMEFMASLHLV